LKKKTETEPKPGQTDRFRFGFLGQKPFGFSGFGLVFSVWLDFFSLARFFSGFLSVLVWFGSVWFFAYKTETEPNRQNRNRTEPAGFLKNIIGLIGFFFGSVFSVIFFPVFSV